MCCAYILGVQAGNFVKSAKKEKWVAERELKRKYVPGNLGQLQIGTVIPNYYFYDLDGNRFELSDLANKHGSTLICYFINDCDACHHQLTILEESIASIEPHAGILLMTNSNPFEVIPLKKSLNLNIPILYDHLGAYSSHLDIADFPFSILIDSELVVKDLYPNVLLAEEIRGVVGMK